MIFINKFSLLCSGQGALGAILMICASALTAPCARYDGPSHGGMANGTGVFVKADPFCRNFRCRIEVPAAFCCL